jgi:hypothetical protein
MGGTTRRALRGRRRPLVVAALAAGLLTACAPPAPPVQPAAATAALPTTPWTDPVPWAGTRYPDLPVQQAPSGLQVPQPPRPVHVGTNVPRAAYGVSPTYTPPTASCGGYSNPRRIVPGVTAAAGTATVRWMADGHTDVQGYRISAVSQALGTGRQPAPAQQSVARPAGCVPLTVTMTGLTRGVAYVFWMEEQTLDPRTGAVRFVQVGTSDAVLIG